MFGQILVSDHLSLAFLGRRQDPAFDSFLL